MKEHSEEIPASTWTESHPWLIQTTETEDEDTVGEVIRYSLDEMRIA